MLTIRTCLLLIGLAALISCSPKRVDQQNAMTVANEFVDAFYSFDKQRLEAVAAHAGESLPGITFYQGWAEGGNYKVVTRHPCLFKNDTLLICPVTVEDDLIKALQLDMHVTDSFHLTIIENQIRSIETSSNDPAIFHEAMDWVNKTKADQIAELCKENDGEDATPGDCVKAFVQGFVEFKAQRKE